MTDHEITATYLALIKNSESDVRSWLSHFEKRFPNMSASEHTGDCTNEPWACPRCIHEQAMISIIEYRKALSTEVASEP